MKLSLSIGVGLFCSAASLACSRDLPSEETSKTASNDRPASARVHPGTTQDDGRPIAADDTGKNERDRGNTQTPTDQGNGEADLEITQKIRQAVMADDSVSTTAKNAKIITERGTVTLRGPVDSARERSAVGALAQKVAGVSAVNNQLEVKK